MNGILLSWTIPTLVEFGAYHLEFASSIHQLVGLGGLFCQLNVTEQGSLVTTIETGQDATESLALTDGGFCQKQTLYISDYVKFVSL